MSGTAASSEAGPRKTPRRYGRVRLFVCTVLEHFSRLLGGRVFYRRHFLSPSALRVRHERVEVADLPRGLAGLKVAQLSDLHAGAFLGAGDLVHAVERTNALGPDVIVITGDFISHHWEECLAILPDLEQLEASHGVYAIFGNHDYHGRHEADLARELGAVGVRVLRNECVRLDSGAGVLALVGLEDLEESRALDLQGPRSALREGDVELVLCHNPVGGPAIARGGCAAILAGHTHGGQLDLPLLRRLGHEHPGDRIELGSTALITSRGLGVSVLPLRLCSPAEIVLVELAPAPQEQADVR